MVLIRRYDICSSLGERCLVTWDLRNGFSCLMTAGGTNAATYLENVTKSTRSRDCMLIDIVITADRTFIITLRHVNIECSFLLRLGFMDSLCYVGSVFLVEKNARKESLVSHCFRTEWFIREKSCRSDFAIRQGALT